MENDSAPVILLVDDDPNDEELARIALERAQIPHRLQVAHDGAEALDWLLRRAGFAERAEEAPPCLVLLDLKLPKVNGLEVLEMIRLDERTRHLPVVVFTSSVEDKDLAESYRRGANAYVRKPVDFRAYKALIADVGGFWVRHNQAPVPRGAERIAVMTTPLRVLHVEDSPDDEALLLIQLRRAGFDVSGERVETAEAFAAALEERTWDVIIADHSLPAFDASRALQMLKDKGLDLPFIVMSGVITAPKAIQLMQAGAHDFVSKDEPARLEPVIQRELREAANRRARRQADADREQLVAQLQAAHRAKDEFLAMLGHELRNPLAPIVTALQLMKLRSDGAPSRERDIIERQVNHMLRLVDDLFDVARIARGKVELERHTIELAAAVARGIEIASPLLEQRRHHFSVAVPPRGLRVEADEARLAQVISNLLTNAARYTAPGGHIALTGAREGQEVVLRVKDNGIGIDAETLPRIFEVFVQGRQTIDRSEGGLGIGLALVRNLVTLHGGTVSAHSEGRDQGSELTVRLPFAAAANLQPASADPPALPRAPAQHGTNRVLIVDDNQDALEMLAEAVRSAGHEVEVAHDGPSALAQLARVTPTVIVLDIGLPVMDGYEVARRIRALPQHRTTTLVALTGYGQASDRQRSQDAGFDLHLVKPIDISELLFVVDGAEA